MAEQEETIDLKEVFKFLCTNMPLWIILVLVALMFLMYAESEKQISNCNAYWLDRERETIKQNTNLKPPLASSPAIPPLELIHFNTTLE